MSAPRVYIIIADTSSLPIVQTRAGRLFKVGISQNPKARLAQLQTGNPFRLSIEIGDLCFNNTLEAEKEIHRRLSRWAVGGEWFWGDPDEAYETAVNIMCEEADAAFERYKRGQA